MLLHCLGATFHQPSTCHSSLSRPVLPIAAIEARRLLLLQTFSRKNCASLFLRAASSAAAVASATTLGGAASTLGGTLGGTWGSTGSTRAASASAGLATSAAALWTDPILPRCPRAKSARKPAGYCFRNAFQPSAVPSCNANS